MKNGIGWVLVRIRRRIPMMVLMTAAHMGQAILGVAFALGTRGVIDGAMSGDGEVFRRACLMQGAIILGLLLCQIIHRHLRELLVAEMDRDWKTDLLHGLLRSDYAAVSAFHSGELLNRMNNDVRVLNTGLVDALPNVAALLTRLVAALVVLAALEPWFAFGICAGGLAVIVVTGFVRRNLKKLHKQVSEQEGRVSGFLQEVADKLLMVQSLDVSEEIERRASGLMATRFRLQRKRKNASLAAGVCVNILSQCAGFAALVWCGGKLLRGRITIGSLTAVTQLVSQLQAPFANLSAIFPKYVAMTAAAERLKELTDLKREEPTCRSGEELYARLRSIRAGELCFSYDRDVLLDRAKFEIPRGSFVVITGQSGIGKSTLLKLLLGVYHPDSGGLYLELDGETIPVDRSVRRLFAYVPQGNLLLSGTIRDNLLIPKPDASQEEIDRALYVSAMDEYISQLPEGLDTILGEDGAGLSEGQAQRLAIGRAILGGAPVLLLDESTSALDEETERTVLRRIRELKDRTCIAVTHRSASLEMCDMHLHIQPGEVLVKTARMADN